MSIQKQVSIKRAIQQAMDNLGIETNELVPVMMVWAVDAETRIGSYTQYERKIFVKDLSGCKVELGCEYMAVLGVLLGDHGCDCGTLFKNIYNNITAGLRTSNTMGFLVIDGGSVSPSATAKWHIQDNSLIFPSSYQSGKITIEALVRRIDKDGWPMINENHVPAIAEFLEWMYMKRSRHKVGGKNYSRTEIQDQFLTWSRMAANAHAKDGEPGPAQIAEIAAMINDPLSGYGGAYWLHQDRYYGSI